MVNYKNCPNCGKKGLYLTKNVFLDNKKARCKYCGMEFEPVVNKGILVMKSEIPTFEIGDK